MYIRLNSFRLDLNEMVYLLKLDNIDVIQHNHFKDFFKVISGQKDILRNDLFLKGIISIQDPASGAVVELVDPQKMTSYLMFAQLQEQSLYSWHKGLEKTEEYLLLI